MTENKEFPFVLYTVNLDYDFPIPHLKWIQNQRALDMKLEECKLYGYVVIDHEQYKRYLKEGEIN